MGAHDGVSVFSQVGVSGSDLSSFIRMQIDSRTFKCGLHCAYLEYPFTSSSLLVCIAIAITVFTSHYYTHSLQVSHLPLQPLSVPPFPSFLFPRFRFFSFLSLVFLFCSPFLGLFLLFYTFPDSFFQPFIPSTIPTGLHKTHALTDQKLKNTNNDKNDKNSTRYSC